MASFWYLLPPTLAFLVFMAARLKASLRKLSRTRSHVNVYYVFVWAITLLNCLRCIVQLVPAAALWNGLWLATRAGMLLVEVAVAVFVLHGLTAMTTHQALVRTLATAGAVTAVETALKVTIIYGLRVPLFLDWSTAADPLRDMRWSKWAFWLLRAALPAATYAAAAALPSTPWRGLLPVRPALYRYAACLAGAYGLEAAGALLVGCRVPAGYCVFGAGAWLYDALYAPLVYAAFLADFFDGEELTTDQLLYSEMREAEFV